MTTTRINADPTERALVRSAAMPWAPSPLPGVERRMLERIGGEVARATSVVRYAPNSRFAEHEHGGGEELLVLDGVFEDEDGRYPAGTYVRNPPGSRHAPWSEPGCVLLVKLWQMHPGDVATVCIDTTDPARWPAAVAGGVAALDLHDDGRECVRILHFAPAARWPAREIAGGEELFVIEGEVADGAERYRRGDWLRQPPGRAPGLASPGGCRLWVKSGHLLDPPPLPAE